MSQHMEALDKANKVRLGRAEVKRDVHNGKCTVIDVLECMPYVCESMSIYELLTSQRRWGRRRALKLLKSYTCRANLTGIRESKKLKFLTPLEKDFLILKLSSHR